MVAPTRSDGVRRRDALLDAALRCFAARGVLATGIEDVRREAKASPSSIYHLFDGLAGVTLALLVRTFERLFAHLAERVSGPKSAKRTVIALVDGHLEWVFAHRDEARFLYQATALELTPGAGEELQAKKAAALTPVVEKMNRLVATGALPPWPVIAFDVVLLGPSHEACRRLLAGAPIDPAWLRATLPGLAWRSVARARSRPPKPPTEGPPRRPKGRAAKAR